MEMPQRISPTMAKTLAGDNNALARSAAKGKVTRPLCIANQLDHFMLFRTVVTAPQRPRPTAETSEASASHEQVADTLAQPPRQVDCTEVAEIADQEVDCAQRGEASPVSSARQRRRDRHSRRAVLKRSSKSKSQSLEDNASPSTSSGDLRFPSTSSSGYSSAGSRQSLHLGGSSIDEQPDAWLLRRRGTGSDPGVAFYDLQNYLDSQDEDDACLTPAPKRVSSLNSGLLSSKRDKSESPAVDDRGRSVSERTRNSEKLLRVKKSMNAIIADLESIGLRDPQFESLTELVSSRIESSEPPVQETAAARQPAGSPNVVSSHVDKHFYNEGADSDEGLGTLSSLSSVESAHPRQYQSEPVAPASISWPPPPPTTNSAPSNYLEVDEPIYETIPGDVCSDDDFDLVTPSDSLCDAPPELPARNYPQTVSREALPYAFAPVSTLDHHSTSAAAEHRRMSTGALPGAPHSALSARKPGGVEGGAKRIRMGIAAKTAWDSRFSGPKAVAPLAQTTAPPTCRPLGMRVDHGARAWNRDGASGVLV